MYKQLLLIILLIILFCGSKLSNDGGCLQVDIVLLVDLSGSVGGNEKFISNASSAFIERFDLNENGIRLSLIAFSSNVVVLSELTSNKENLLNGLLFIENNPMLNETDLTMGLTVSLNQLNTNGRNYVKKIIILVTDGEPNDDVSCKNVANIIKLEHEIEIYGILIKNGYSDPDYLKIISSPNCYVSTDYGGLVNVFEQLDICM